MCNQPIFNKCHSILKLSHATGQYFIKAIMNFKNNNNFWHVSEVNEASEEDKTKYNKYLEDKEYAFFFLI